MSATAAQNRSDVLIREFWHVAGIGDVTRLEQILAHGVDVNASDRTGVTALMRAAYHGELPAVQALIEHGADPDAKDSGGLTALMMAKHSGHAEIVDALRSSGASEKPRRRVSKTLPVDPELEEAPTPITNEKPRTLHEPPEIWEMVHTTQADAAPEPVSASAFPLAGILPSARTLIVSASVVIVFAAAVSGFFALRRFARATDATAIRAQSVSEQSKESKAPPSATTQSIQNATSAEQTRFAAKLNQPAATKPLGDVAGARATQPGAPMSAQLSAPSKKTAGQAADKSRAGDHGRGLNTSRAETLPKTPARTRGSNNDKTANSASLRSEPIKAPSPQVTAPPKPNAPKPKVIQWP